VAGNPERPAVVANHVTGAINQTTAVSGEESSRGDRMKVPPWISSVSTRHCQSVSVAEPVAERSSRDIPALSTVRL
jgi:hypothetical protein